MSQHAIAGFQGKGGAMPAKGGNADLTDDEVRRAVAFMANKAGATWKEPAIAAPAAAVAAAPVSAAPIATAAAAPIPAAPAPAAAAGKPDGKKIFDASCAACHATGIAGAPKFGDKAADAAHRAGVSVLYTHATGVLPGQGGVMPRRAGVALPDPDVKAAVDYMVAGVIAQVGSGFTARASPSATSAVRFRSPFAASSGGNGTSA
jgi:cytochrome c5